MVPRLANNVVPVVSCRLPLRPARRTHAVAAPPTSPTTALELAAFLRGDAAVLPSLVRRLETETLGGQQAAELLWEIASVPTPEFLADHEAEVRDLLRALVRRLLRRDS